MTTQDVRALLAAAAQHIGGEAGRREAEILLAHVLGRDRAFLFAQPEFAPPAAQVERFLDLAARRASGHPVAYLTGTREFWSLTLRVGPAVLIPRAETEWLVELALARLLPGRVRIADLGTGSGAVALALARERPHAHVVATDASGTALALARVNAAANAIENVEFREGDWFQPIAGERFALIVSNPPYIAEDDPHLVAGDLRFEPRTALVSGPDGLDAIRELVANAPGHLDEPGGWLLFEHGHEQGGAARALLVQAGFGEVFTEKDLGDRDRVSGGRRV